MLTLAILRSMTAASDPTPPGAVTRCLERLCGGEREAGQELLELVYSHLRDIAEAAMHGERRAHTLDPTALVHEAWLRLLGRMPRSFSDRRHFLRAAARAMRCILIDHARARSRRERRLDAYDGLMADWFDDIAARRLDLLALDEALVQLESVDEELVHLVELRFFSGLSIAETATATGRSTASVERDWRCARALLRRLMTGGDE